MRRIDEGDDLRDRPGETDLVLDQRHVRKSIGHFASKPWPIFAEQNRRHTSIALRDEHKAELCLTIAKAQRLGCQVTGHRVHDATSSSLPRRMSHLGGGAALCL